MRKVLPALLAVVVAFVVWLVLDEAEPPSPSASRMELERHPPRDVDHAAHAAVAHPESVGERAAIVADGAVPATASETASAPATCIVFGSVVDTNGAPQVDMRVVLSSQTKWAEGVDVPAVADAPGRFGFETQTDASGRFAFDVVVPTTFEQHLSVEPHRHVERPVVEFGPNSPQRRKALAAGEHDVGMLRVGVRGALVGRVVDTSGAPLAGVAIDAQSSGHERTGSTTSNATGAFVLGHLTAGHHEVLLKLLGYAALPAGSFEVGLERDLDIGTLVLEPATTITGRVRDVHGAPIAGARVRWRSTTNWITTTTNTAVDGSFTLALFEDEPHPVDVRAKGFEPWGSIDYDSTSVFESGARDVEIVLTPRTLTRFVVLDAATRAPVESYAIAIGEGDGIGSGRYGIDRPRYSPVEARPGGVSEVFARPLLDAVAILSESHRAFQDTVQHDVEGVPQQTILLHAANRVTGRVWRDGEPLASANVTLTPGSMFGSSPSADLSEAARAVQAAIDAEFLAMPSDPVETATTDADGRFSMTARTGGEARLHVDVGDGWSLVRCPIAVPYRSDVDLGDLHATRSGSIAGRLIAPSGVDPLGLWAVRGRGDDSRTVSVDGEGRFTFDNVQPGWHLVSIAKRGTEFTGTEFVGVLVEPGRATEVLIDASDAGSTELEIEFVLTGIDATGLEVYVWPIANGRQGGPLGRIGADGSVRGTAPALGDAYASVMTHSGRISFDDQPFVLAANARVSVRLERAFGSVEMALPQNLELPEAALFEVFLTPRADAPHASRSRFEWTQRGESTSLPNGVRSIDGGIAFDAEEGTYDVRWRLCSADASLEFIRQPDGTVLHGRPALHERFGEVVVRAGERAVVRLE
jgi:protocatechuate 3,4-dioxygenase beta subunit